MVHHTYFSSAFDCVHCNFNFINHICTTALLVIVAVMVMKYINEYEDTGLEDVGGSAETDPLQPAGKTVRSAYGTCEDSSSNSSNTVIKSSSEDLYDEKICEIRYTEQRDCFLVPCGHCATCDVCAERYVENSKRFRICWCSIEIWYLITEITCCRIFDGETKTCPI
ncbi:unnamed protein product [Malus baccata var. baccata]